MPSRKAKGRNISHELKTPLAAIEGYALLLEEGGSSPELKEYARKISESSRQLSHMTGNILKLSRLEKQEILSDKELFPWTSSSGRLFFPWSRSGTPRIWTLIWSCPR